MTEKKYALDISEDTLKELAIDPEKPIQLIWENQKITLQQPTKEPHNQSISLRWFLLPTLFASLIFFALITYQKISFVPLTGNISIASYVLILGLISGMLSFTVFFIRQKRRDLSVAAKLIYWRNFPTILISFAIMLAFVLLVAFYLLGILFEKATFDRFTATVLFALFTSIIHYVMIYFALALSPRLILQLLIGVIVGGVGFSMITNSSLLWWQKNFSFLGTEDAKNAWQFNLTLMISALLMIALVDYLFVAIQKYYKRTWQLTTLRILLTLTAVNFGAVGFFPNNGLGRLHELHNQAANFLVYMIIILIIGIKWLLPHVTKEFLTISYGIALILVVADFLFLKVGYFSLTAFEMIAFILALWWILLLLQNLLNLLEAPKKNYTLQLLPVKNDK